MSGLSTFSCNHNLSVYLRVIFSPFPISIKGESLPGSGLPKEAPH